MRNCLSWPQPRPRCTSFPRWLPGAALWSPWQFLHLSHRAIYVLPGNPIHILFIWTRGLNLRPGAKHIFYNYPQASHAPHTTALYWYLSNWHFWLRLQIHAIMHCLTELFPGKGLRRCNINNVQSQTLALVTKSASPSWSSTAHYSLREWQWCDTNTIISHFGEYQLLTFDFRPKILAPRLPLHTRCDKLSPSSTHSLMQAQVSQVILFTFPHILSTVRVT